MGLQQDYEQGKRIEVWNRLRELGDAVLQEPLWTDAQQVAAETMKRARENVERLIARLDELGYTFLAPKAAGMPWRSPIGVQVATGDFLVHRPPTSDDGVLLQRVEGEFGILPLALRAWYERVGSVSLAGNHPLLNTSSDWAEGADGTSMALCVDPLEVAPLGMISDPYAMLERDEATGYVGVLIAADAKQKANISGGHEYTVPLQPWMPDPPVLYEPHNVSFVEYLRLAFRWGGFPGWEQLPNRPSRELAYLSEGLLPI